MHHRAEIERELHHFGLRIISQNVVSTAMKAGQPSTN
jgi:hypothetical protein